MAFCSLGNSKASSRCCQVLRSLTEFPAMPTATGRKVPRGPPCPAGTARPLRPLRPLGPRRRPGGRPQPAGYHRRRRVGRKGRKPREAAMEAEAREAIYFLLVFSLEKLGKGLLDEFEVLVL